MTEYILVYLLIINVIAFVIYGDDKARARRGAWRISEAKLILLAAIGGSVGAWLGMHVFHHKTKHMKFVIGFRVIFLVQLAGFLQWNR